MTQYSILHILLSVYGVGNCCAVVIIIQCFPTASSRTPRRWLPTETVLGHYSIFIILSSC
jgi:hypothetical protein